MIRVQEEGSTKAVHLGLGFADRSDSFDINVTLQEHFKGLRVEEEALKPQEALNLGLKEGQTIKVNINIPRNKKSSKVPSAVGASVSGGVLPPPKTNMADAVAAAGIKVDPNTKMAPPPNKPANPNWIQF